VVIEATVALAVFMFAVLTLLLTADICIAQAKIGGALASAAKSISQYSHIYYKLNIDEAQRKSYDASAGARATAEQLLGGVSALAEAMTAPGAAGSLGAAMEDMAGLAGTELGEEGKNLLGGILARSLMSRNFMSSPDDDPDAFLRRYRVSGGLDGLDFTGTSLMAYGGQEEIRLVVSYEVSVIRLLGIDVSFRFTQRAETLAWGRGVALGDGDGAGQGDDGDDGGGSVWDWGNLARGRHITDKEKEQFKYTNNVGFDGYDDTGGKNEFIQVASMHGRSYAEPAGVAERLSDALGSMRGIVSGYGESIAVTDAGGAPATIWSNPDTRTYKIILVVPENADTAMISAASAAFEAEWLAAGERVSVEVKAAYGVPSASGSGGKR
jgi:hypothetical protein